MPGLEVNVKNQQRSHCMFTIERLPLLVNFFFTNFLENLEIRCYSFFYYQK